MKQDDEYAAKIYLESILSYSRLRWKFVKEINTVLAQHGSTFNKLITAKKRYLLYLVVANEVLDQHQRLIQY